MPARVAVLTEDPPLVQPVALRLRFAAVADDVPSDGQVGRGHGR